MLKKYQRREKRLCAFLCFLCARRKKNRKQKNEKSVQCNVLNTNVLLNHFECVCVYLRKPVCGDINLVYILTS